MMSGAVMADRTDVNSLVGGFYVEDFEDTAAWDNGALVATTNGWYAGAGDLSYVTNMTYVLPDGFSTPISGISGYDSTARVLRLNTETATLTNQIAEATSDFQAAPIWLDTMVQFVTTDSHPEITDNTVKLALYAYVGESSTNLAVYHSYFVVGSGFITTNTDTGVAVDPALWHRVTVELQHEEGGEGYAANGLQAFRMKLNGQLVTLNGAPAYGDSWYDTVDSGGSPAGGAWFLSAGDPGNETAKAIDSLAFQGTGYLDDLVLRKTDPYVIAPVGQEFLITQVISDPAHGFASPAGEITVQQGGSTQIVYTASDWYRITSLTQDGVEKLTITPTNAFTWSVSDVQANISNEVTIAPLAHGYGNASTAWLSTWSEAQIAAGDSDPYDVDTEYLLNTDPTADSDVAFTVTAITAEAGAGTDVKVTVKLTRTTDLGDINGTLWLYGTDDLDVPFEKIAGQFIEQADFDGDVEEFTFNEATDAKKFYKAVIE
jgi:hypothetical protein